jgi:uncharacterized protein (TIGR00106 family)
MLFGLSVLPVGSGDDSLVEPVADVVGEIARSGLPYQVNGMSTVIEGEWDEVMPVIRAAEQNLRREHDRVFMVITIDDHAGARDRIRKSVSDVERVLGRDVSQ